MGLGVWSGLVSRVRGVARMGEEDRYCSDAAET